MRAAAFFDLDKTILGTSSSLVFTKPMYEQGLINRTDVVKSGYRQFIFTLGSADHEQTERMREYLSKLVAGWDVATLRNIVRDSLDDRVTPTVHAEALELIAQHKAAGRAVIVVSASGSEIVEPIAELLGADYTIATEMSVEAGRYTGEIKHYTYGINKATAMREFAQSHQIDLAASYAYSDSITDLPMLEAVGNPFVVNPDTELRNIAIDQGWPVLTFEKPAALKRPIIDHPEQQKQLLIAGGILAIFLAWRAARRRKAAA